VPVIGIDDPAGLIEILVEESTAQAAPGIGKQRIHRTALGCRVELIHALDGR
jgi:hypothetical protein